MALPARVLVVLKPSKKIPVFIQQSRELVQAVQANSASIPNPNPPLATILAELDALEKAETAVKTQRGVTPARDIRYSSAKALLHQLKAHIQQIVDADSARGLTLLGALGLKSKKAPARTKEAFSVKQDHLSGSVDLEVKASKGAVFYEWQYAGPDHAWVNAPTTPQTHTTIHGLTPALTYSFRYKVGTRVGEGDWSQVITLLVK